MNKENERKQAQKLVQELRRGTIVLAVLNQLQVAHYGYSLRKALANGGFDVKEGTLYPLLRRLESQGLLSSEWVVTENRPRRYYVISKLGRVILLDLKAEWKYLGQVMSGLLTPEKGDA